MRASVYPALCTELLLQRGVSAGGAGVVGREAQQRYRSSEKGRARRREQSRRWRERRREKESAAAEKDGGAGSAERCEGHAAGVTGQKNPLRSPGLLRNRDVLGSLSSATILLFFLSQGVTSSAPA